MRIKMNSDQQEIVVSFDFTVMNNHNNVPRLTCRLEVLLKTGYGHLFTFGSRDPRDGFDCEELFETLSENLNALIAINGFSFQFQVDKHATHKDSSILTIQRKNTSSISSDEQSIAARSTADIVSSQLTREDAIHLYEFLYKHKLLDNISQMDFVFKIEFLNQRMLNLEQKETYEYIWKGSVLPKLPIIYEYNVLLRKSLQSFFSDHFGEGLGGIIQALVPIAEYAEAGVPAFDEKRPTERRVTLSIHSDDIFIAIGKVIHNQMLEWIYNDVYQISEGNLDESTKEEAIRFRKISMTTYCALGKLFCEAVNGKKIEDVPGELISNLSQFDDEFLKHYPNFKQKAFARGVTNYIKEYLLSIVLDADHPEEAEIDSPFSLATEMNITSGFELLTLLYLKVLKELGVNFQYSIPTYSERRKYIALHYQAKEQLKLLDDQFMQQKKVTTIDEKLKDKQKIVQEEEKEKSSAAALITAASPIYAKPPASTTSTASTTEPASAVVSSDSKTENQESETEDSSKFMSLSEPS